MSRDDIDVLDANSAFYRAFARRDVPAMEALWARAAPVACIHPGWDAVRGREAVMASWRAILGGDAPDVSCSSASAQVLGDAAFVVCREHVPGGPPIVATNVFVREGGAWKICVHHGGLVAQERGEAPPGARA